MKVEYRPWKSLEVKSLTLFASAEELVEFATTAVPPNAAGVATFFWANGVIFRFQALAGGQGSEALTQRLLDGRLVWEAVEAAPMPVLAKELHLPEKPLVAIRIQDVAKNDLFAPAASWLKELMTHKSQSRRRSRA